MSVLFGLRHKKKGEQKTLQSMEFLLRGGYCVPLGAHGYALLNPGIRVLEKCERLLAKRAERLGAQRVQTVVYRRSGDDAASHPTDNRNAIPAPLLMILQQQFKSYRQLPFSLYSITERSLLGLDGASGAELWPFSNDTEFTLISCEGAAQTRMVSDDTLTAVIHPFFDEIGITGWYQIEASPIDGSVDTGCNRFFLPHDRGTETAVRCSRCSYHAALDSASGVVTQSSEEELPLVLIPTPEQKTIRQLSLSLQKPASCFAKACFFEAESCAASGEVILCLVRGDLEVNEAKVEKIVGFRIRRAADERLKSIGAVAGFASPIGIGPCRIIADESVARTTNLICGANIESYHYANFNLRRDAANCQVDDIAVATNGLQCRRCGGSLMLQQGFSLGEITRHREDTRLAYQDAAGATNHPSTSTLDLSINRLICAVIEKNCDSFGPVWPSALAPWEIAVTPLSCDDAAHRFIVENLYTPLQEAGFHVLYDDRNERAGVAFADADLLGVPLRICYTPQKGAQGIVEYKIRHTQTSGVVSIAEIVQFARCMFKAGK